MQFYCIANGIDLAKVDSIDFPKLDPVFQAFSDCAGCSPEEERMKIEPVLKILSKEMNAKEAELFSSVMFKFFSRGTSIAEGNKIAVSIDV